MSIAVNNFILKPIKNLLFHMNFKNGKDKNRKLYLPERTCPKFPSVGGKDYYCI